VCSTATDQGVNHNAIPLLKDISCIYPWLVIDRHDNPPFDAQVVLQIADSSVVLQSDGGLPLGLGRKQVSQNAAQVNANLQLTASLPIVAAGHGRSNQVLTIFDQRLAVHHQRGPTNDTIDMDRCPVDAAVGR
jgi:hypothetical protein